jgi:hypothetical protein
MKTLKAIYKKLDKTDAVLISTLIVSALFFIINL